MTNLLLGALLLVVGLLLGVAIGDGPMWPATVAVVVGIVLMVNGALKAYDARKAQRN